MTETEAITRLRRMTADNATSLPDPIASEYLTDALVKDSAGLQPGEEGYVDTWDLHRAAALRWGDKAGELARTAFDLQTDMTKANRSGQIENAWKMARYHSTKTIPRIVGFSLIAEEGTTDNVSADV